MSFNRRVIGWTVIVAFYLHFLFSVVSVFIGYADWGVTRKHFSATKVEKCVFCICVGLILAIYWQDGSDAQKLHFIRQQSVFSMPKGVKMVEKAFTPSTSINVLCLEKACPKFKLHWTFDMKRLPYCFNLLRSWSPLVPHNISSESITKSSWSATSFDLFCLPPLI